MPLKTINLDDSHRLTLFFLFLLPTVVRPVLTAPSGQPGQPLVLTQAQLAQLQQSGILKVAAGNSRQAAAPAAAAPVVTSASNAIGLGGVAGKPIVIKTEPAMVMSPLQATGRPTVLQAVPAAAVAASNANPDNDVSTVQCSFKDMNFSMEWQQCVS